MDGQPAAVIQWLTLVVSCAALAVAAGLVQQRWQGPDDRWR
jgi:hypothetical protein